MKVFLLIVFVFFVNIVKAQNNDSTYQHYLNDNNFIPERVYYYVGKSEIIKTDIAEILDGNIPIIWEHRFTDGFGLSSGLGIILPYSFADIIYGKNRELSNEDALFLITGLNPLFENRHCGFSMKIEPVLISKTRHFFVNNVDENSLSMFYSLKSYERLNISEFGISLGACYDFNKFILQTNVAISYLTQYNIKNENDIKYISIFGMSGDSDNFKDLSRLSLLKISLQIQIGYKLSLRRKK